MRSSLKGRDELAVRVQIALSLPTKKEAEHVVNAVNHELGNHSGQSSRYGWVHVEAQKLWQVRYPSQGGDSPEDWVQGRDHSDEDEAEDQVHQFRGASPAGAGWVIRRAIASCFAEREGTPEVHGKMDLSKHMRFQSVRLVGAVGIEKYPTHLKPCKQ